MVFVTGTGLLRKQPAARVLQPLRATGAKG